MIGALDRLVTILPVQETSDAYGGFQKTYSAGPEIPARLELRNWQRTQSRPQRGLQLTYRVWMRRGDAPQHSDRLRIEGQDFVILTMRDEPSRKGAAPDLIFIEVESL